MGQIEEKFVSLLSKHKVVGIDTMIFIYHFESNLQFAPLTLLLFDHIERGRGRAVTSILTKLEIMVKPKADGNQDIVKTYDFLLGTFPNLQLKDIDDRISDLASTLRANYNIRTPDAIQIASALADEATLFVTNDSNLKNIDEIEILVLKNYTAE